MAFRPLTITTMAPDMPDTDAPADRPIGHPEAGTGRARPLSGAAAPHRAGRGR